MILYFCLAFQVELTRFPFIVIRTKLLRILRYWLIITCYLFPFSCGDLSWLIYLLKCKELTTTMINYSVVQTELHLLAMIHFIVASVTHLSYLFWLIKKFSAMYQLTASIGIPITYPCSSLFTPYFTPNLFFTIYWLPFHRSVELHNRPSLLNLLIFPLSDCFSPFFHQSLNLIYIKSKSIDRYTLLGIQYGYPKIDQL